MQNVMIFIHSEMYALNICLFLTQHSIDQYPHFPGLTLSQYLPSGHSKSNKQLRSPGESPYMGIIDSSFASPTPPKKDNCPTLLKREDPYLDFRHLSPSCFQISSNKLPYYMLFGATTTPPLQRDPSSSQSPSDKSRTTSSEGNRKKFSLWRPY